MKLKSIPDLETSTCAGIAAKIEKDENGYIESYPKLLRAVSVLAREPSEETACGVAYLAYGWMPTTLKSVDFGNVAGGGAGLMRLAVDSSTAGDAANTLDAVGDASPINNSWVGLSKFLHFINPQVFPIWDSKIAKQFGYSYPVQYNRSDVYRAYLGFIHACSGSDFAYRIKNMHTAYEISDVRAVECGLFLTAK